MFKKILSCFVIVCFSFSLVIVPSKASANGVLGLPEPGTMVNLSQAYEPVIIKGLTVHKDNPFLFDFIVDVGQDKMSGQPLKQEGEKLIKYFLASLAIPEKDLWVNLSPYEKNKMIPEALGQTDMGRDLLAQDYILKQITASLIYPEKQLGKTFWDKVYAKAQALYGTTQVPVNTFNKVWIMADRAEVFERNNTAFVVDQHLKVMLEEDYLSLQKHGVIANPPWRVKQSFKAQEIASSPTAPRNDTSTLGSQIVREIILPEIEKEVNTGKNFANLRQIFNSIILSSWYKKNLKQALLNQVYADKSKVNGVIASEAKQSREQIYEQYLKAYKKGVFNYIKEEIVPTTSVIASSANGGTKQSIVPRKYFSGGITELQITPTVITDLAIGSTKLANVLPSDKGRLKAFETGFDAAMTADTSNNFLHADGTPSLKSPIEVVIKDDGTAEVLKARTKIRNVGGFTRLSEKELKEAGVQADIIEEIRHVLAINREYLAGESPGSSEQNDGTISRIFLRQNQSKITTRTIDGKPVTLRVHHLSQGEGLVNLSIEGPGKGRDRAFALITNIPEKESAFIFNGLVVIHEKNEIKFYAIEYTRVIFPRKSGHNEEMVLV
ncbi:MAG: hypothetical protein HY209_03370 [Candidatus Omnitrophica bacterium]|nr:hypothetical protein [Candidatus Omnitrophota bacterium]